jgi:hypothetical protein
MHYAPLMGTAGIEVRQHGTTLYNSIYRGDDMMIVNAHRYNTSCPLTGKQASRLLTRRVAARPGAQGPRPGLGR